MHLFGHKNKNKYFLGNEKETGWPFRWKCATDKWRLIAGLKKLQNKGGSNGNFSVTVWSTNLTRKLDLSHGVGYKLKKRMVLYFLYLLSANSKNEPPHHHKLLGMPSIVQEKQNDGHRHWGTGNRRCPNCFHHGREEKVECQPSFHVSFFKIKWISILSI